MPPTPDWVLRYTAARFGFPSWSDDAPDRLAMVSNRGGSWQVWTHDLADGSWRQASDEPIGVEEIIVLPDGRVAWFRDDSGAETGRWVVRPFEAGPATPLFPALPTGWPLGMAMAPGGRAVVGLEVEGTYRVWVVEPGGQERPVYGSARPAGVGAEWPGGLGGISTDGRWLVIRHTEHGDILHAALRILDARTGEVVADLDDTPHRLGAGPWSPEGERFSFTQERDGRARPGIWDLATGRRDLVVDLPGDVYPLGWYPNEDAILVRHEFEARAQLYRLAMTAGELTLVADHGGDVEEARVRPDGSVWARVTDGTTPPRIVAADGAIAIVSPEQAPPAGRPFRDLWTTNDHGDRIQALVVTPDGQGPFPLVVSVHGGPEWHERDAWDPETLAFVDAGYAVALPNYRGSTGYGVAFREALVGNVCHCESEDIIAVLDALVADGTADPAHVYWSGWSWGGCLACFNAGVNPSRFRAVFAGIPAGDFIAAHWACAPELRAWDDAVYGGSPDDVPEAYRRSDPMTYVSHVRSPTIVVAGENDPRCPIEGITPWVDAVRSNGVEVEVHTYGAGHHANGMTDQVRHMELVLDFFARHA